ncbi:MAG: hypothetical protein DWQ36_12625 [Acidobacteria bacterium]|nr:MAG: hypothetical protein DWQ30_25020 [Acidobacteriota bacterium]REK07383.1 MAG: hypothetical protein DWQ36_12625 [Acidobacteriota bacterium]
MGSYEGVAEEIYDYAGDRGFATFDLEVFVQDSGWVGERGWKNSSMEGLVDIQSDELTLLKMSSAASPLYYLWKLYGEAAFTGVAPSEFDGAPTFAVSVTNSALVLHVDPESLRVVALVIPQFLETRYDDFREVAGVTVPATVDTEIIPASMSITHRFAELLPNVETDPGRFEKPSG